jgi:hypothetical protein
VDRDAKTWINKHVDTIVILGGILTAVLWMNSNMNDLKNEISLLKTDVAIMKTIMILKNIMPAEMAKCSDEK